MKKCFNCRKEHDNEKSIFCKACDENHDDLDLTGGEIFGDTCGPGAFK